MPSLKRITNYFLVTFLIVFAGCATTPPASSLPLRPDSPFYQDTNFFTPFTHAQTIEHIVGPMETLWRISKIYDVDMATLIEVNNIQDPDNLKKGQKLIIPQTFGARPVIPLYPSRRWTHIVIHHTATHEGNALSIDKLHHDRGFWNGLGYHFLIGNGTLGKKQGQIEVGPRWVKQMDGAHANADNMNQVGIGIALVGNFSEAWVDQDQLEALVYLVKTLQDYYGIPDDRVIGHRDVPGKNTECPGNHFPWGQFKNRL